MGLVDKFKKIFYDDIEEDEEPSKKETKKEVKVKEEVKKEFKPVVEDDFDLNLTNEIKTIKEEVVEEAKTDNTFSERELFRSEKTFNFNEFDDITEEPPRKTALDLEKKVSRLDTTLTQTSKPKVFKPSPVISPIYGILDKDYKKEDITEKKEPQKVVAKVETFSYDTVRKKAFPTIQEKEEEPVLRTPREVRETIDDVEEDMNRLSEQTAKIEDLIKKIGDNSSVTIGDLEDARKEEMFEETAEVEIPDTNDKTITDDTLEHDLFNLIDSMYDDKED